METKTTITAKANRVVLATLLDFLATAVPLLLRPAWYEEKEVEVDDETFMVIFYHYSKQRVGSGCQFLFFSKK
jgi:hypothetical protein